MLEWIVGLAALTGMEIVLGIDNIVFITVTSSRLPKEQQPLARKLGLMLALVTRLALLWVLFSMVHGGDFFEESRFKLTDIGIPQAVVVQLSGASDQEHDLHDVHGSRTEGEKPEAVIDQAHLEAANGISIKDMILFFGGLFLIYSSIKEIHEQLGDEEEHEKGGTSFAGVLVRIAVLDIVFSLDSVITAVGMVDSFSVMATAIVVAVVVMLIFAEPISRFVEGNPTLKMLALSFLILIGVMLVAEGVGAHLDKGYIYFAMTFGLIVEVLNIRLRTKKKPTAA